MNDRDQSLHHDVTMLVQLWAPRLKISERIEVKVEEIEAFDGSGEPVDCAMHPATAFPEAQGLWEFVLMVSPSMAAETTEYVERTIVHELVHLIIEPIRESYFRSARIHVVNADEVLWLSEAQAAENRPEAIRRWETLVERLADAFLNLSAKVIWTY